MQPVAETTAQQAALIAAKLFRIGLDALGSRYLQRVYDLKEQFVDGTDCQSELRLQLIWPELHERHERRDFIGMADLLFYEISPLLKVYA